MRRVVSLAVSVGLIAGITVGQAVFHTFFGDQTLDTPTLRLGDTSYELDAVRDKGAQERGLSGRASLAKDGGMVFDFGNTGKRCMWMKDMRFDIDIIWLDRDKRITRIERAVSPATYPQSFCADAYYVVELPSGTAIRHGLAQGQTLRF